MRNVGRMFAGAGRGGDALRGSPVAELRSETGAFDLVEVLEVAERFVAPSVGDVEFESHRRHTPAGGRLRRLRGLLLLRGRQFGFGLLQEATRTRVQEG